MEVCRATCVVNRESTVTRMMKPRLRFISTFQGLLGRHQWFAETNNTLQKVPFANCAIWGFFQNVCLFLQSTLTHSESLSFLPPTSRSSVCRRISDALLEILLSLTLLRPWFSWSCSQSMVQSSLHWSSKMPICCPIAAAVACWSPVIIFTWIPALRHFSMLPGTEARGGS